MLPKGLLKEHWLTLSIIVRLIDMSLIFLAGWIAFFIKFHLVTISPLYLMTIFTGILLTPLVFGFFNIYASVRGQELLHHFIHLLQAICALALLLAGLAFFIKVGEIYSRLWFGIWMTTSFICLILFRCIILFSLRFMRAHGLNERRVVIMGAGDLGIKLAGAVQQALWTGFRITAFIDDVAQHKPAQLLHIPVLSMPAQLGDYLIREQVDEIWLALPLRAEARVKEILYQLRHHTITTRFVLDIFGLDLLSHSLTDVAGFPVLNIRSTPMQGINRFIKAIEDRMIAAIILLLISPLFLLIAIGVKYSSKGPVFFKQRRLGWDGRVINIYKFRTMMPHQENVGEITQASLSDVRVTAFGKLLRRTSLDELPQFINVLQGRMSIVGPRPHALAHNEFYKDAIHTYMQRHYVKPGITGWAQVNGWRGETDTLEKMQKRVEYDLYYINNWSLRFDLKIIFLTLFHGFVNRNAY